MPRTCEGCRYWSELIASCEDGGPIRALCLHSSRSGKPYHEQMKWRGCEDYEPGIAIDHPALREDQ